MTDWHFPLREALCPVVPVRPSISAAIFAPALDVKRKKRFQVGEHHHRHTIVVYKPRLAAGVFAGVVSQRKTLTLMTASDAVRKSKPHRVLVPSLLHACERPAC